MNSHESIKHAGVPQAPLRRVTVNGLFGQPAATIDLCDDSLTLLFGANGGGKSTCLRLINHVLSEDYFLLEDEPFESIVLEFADGAVVSFDRNNAEWSETFFDKQGRRFQTSGKAAFDQGAFERWINERTPYHAFDGNVLGGAGPRPVLSKESVDLLKRDFLAQPAHSTKVFWARKASTGSFQIPAGEGESDRPVRTIVRQSRLITSDRLRGVYQTSPRLRRRPGIEDNLGALRITAVAAEIQETISKAREQTRKRSAEIDSQTFHRILERLPRSSSGNKSSPETRGAVGLGQLSVLENELNSLNRRLMECEISTAKLNLPEIASYIDQNVALNQLFQQHLEDLLEKSKAASRPLEQLETLTRIVNERLVGKRLRLSADNGICVKRLSDDVDIPLARLSSGEQHLIVLFHSLIFETTPGGICLIDEPEISLNVDWQENFITDLLTTARIAPQQFLIATHSPQIVGQHSSLLRTIVSSEHDSV
jgi:predicted ATPase